MLLIADNNVTIFLVWVLFIKTSVVTNIIYSTFFQTETEFREWLKEIKQSFQQAQVMLRAGFKIIGSGHRYVTQYSKEENGPVSPWLWTCQSTLCKYYQYGWAPPPVLISAVSQFNWCITMKSTRTNRVLVFCYMAWHSAIRINRN